MNDASLFEGDSDAREARDIPSLLAWPIPREAMTEGVTAHLFERSVYRELPQSRRLRETRRDSSLSEGAKKLHKNLNSVLHLLSNVFIIS